MKKLLSLLLAVVLLAGSLIFALPVLAEDSGITLELNGGTLVDSAYVPTAGENLPTYEGITRAGCTFGGWFTNADFTGAQSFVAVASTTYYARWVVPTVVQNFDSWSATDYSSNIATYKYHTGTGASTSLNTDSYFSYSGNNSAGVYNIDWSANSGNCFHIQGNFFGTNNTENLEEGYFFWITATQDVSISVYLPWSDRYTYTIPAGTKQIITANKVTAYGDGFRIIGKRALTYKSSFYIDDIGTFTTVPYVEALDVTFETNGGTLADPDALYQAGDTLPTFEGVTKAGAIFDGWYKNADFSGDKALTVEDGATYYAKWIKVVETLDNFDSADSLVNWEIWKNSGGAYHSDPTLNTDSANAISGNNSLKLEIDYLNDGNHNGTWNQRIVIAKNASLSADKNSDGLYFYLITNYEGHIIVNLDAETGAQSADKTSGEIDFKVGKNLIMIPWSTFGEGVTQSTASEYSFAIKGRWHNSAIGVVYLDDIGSYGDPTVPSYGAETSEKAALFVTGQDTSTNAGISGGTDNSAVYEVSGKKYVAFRVFGTYVAPAKADGSGADYGKVVVDANGTKKDIVSRHVILGYNNNEPTVDNNYAKSTVTASFENCWNTVENVDGTYTVTYSLLLKDIPQDYVGTAFTVRSAVVTAEETIYSSEVQENVSAQGIYDSAINKGFTIGWFE